MNVAVPWFQHSPMFGQRASWHTVFRPRPLISACSSRYLGEPGARTFSQDGFGVRGSGGEVAGARGMIVGIAEPHNRISDQRGGGSGGGEDGGAPAACAWVRARRRSPGTCERNRSQRPLAL